MDFQWKDREKNNDIWNEIFLKNPWNHLEAQSHQRDCVTENYGPYWKLRIPNWTSQKTEATMVRPCHPTITNPCTMHGHVEGQRARGRPRHTWLDDINKWTGQSSWTTCGQQKIEKIGEGNSWHQSAQRPTWHDMTWLARSRDLRGKLQSKPNGDVIHGGFGDAC